MKNTVTLLEEMSCRAWPALTTRCVGGWRLRFADGLTRRANAVHPLYVEGEHGASLDDRELGMRVSLCEGLYASAGLPVHFKLTPASAPENLEDFLADQGYVRSEAVPVLARDLDDIAPGLPDDLPDGLTFTVEQRRSDVWTAHFFRNNDVPRQRFDLYQQLFDMVGLPTAYVTLCSHQQALAVARAVMDGTRVGLFNIAVAADARRQGHGQQITRALLGWGRAAGAEHAYLQVHPANDPALALYEGLGFYEAYSYWYRTLELPHKHA
ncbi:MAG: GNAT family N-acetyltransferase [Chloroflexota bacterium]